MNASIFFSEKLQQSFNVDGIVSVPFLNAQEVESLLNFYRTMSNGVSDRTFHSTMFIDNADYRKQISNGIKDVILPKVNGLISGYKMLFANFIVKEPSADTGVGIHQDWNFSSPEFTSVNIWIPLVDINEQTGLFYALKGSHRTFQNIRYTPYEDNAYSGLENFIYENASSFYAKAGDAVIYHGGLIHFSKPNVSGSLRVAVGGAMIPVQAPNLHYYRRDKSKSRLEVYEVDEGFYNRFNFFEEPNGVKQIGELDFYDGLPSLDELMSASR